MGNSWKPCAACWRLNQSEVPSLIAVCQLSTTGVSYSAPGTTGMKVCPAKAGAFSGKQSQQGKSQGPCALDSQKEGNRIPKLKKPSFGPS